MVMTHRATVLRSESPSIIKLTPDQQPKDHVGQLACRQYQRPLVRVVGGPTVLADVKRFKSRVAHTNLVGRFDQEIPPRGIPRPRQRSIFGVQRPRLVGTPSQSRIFREGIVRGEPGNGAVFGRNPGPVYGPDARRRGDGLRDGRQIAGDRPLNLPDLTFPGTDGVQMHDQTELARLGFFGSQAEGFLGQALQGVADIVWRFQRRARRFRRFPWRSWPPDRGVLGQHMLRGPAKDVRKKGVAVIFGRSLVARPQAKQFIQVPIFLPGHGLRQLESVPRGDAQGRIARIGRRSGTQSAKADGVRNQKRITGIGFGPNDLGFSQSLDDTGIQQEPLGLPGLQHGGLASTRSTPIRPPCGRIRPFGRPANRSAAQCPPVIRDAIPGPDGSVRRHGTDHMFSLTHINPDNIASASFLSAWSRVVRSGKGTGRRPLIGDATSSSAVTLS